MNTATESKIKPAITITLPVTVPIDRIRCLLCSAFEGGSNYWYSIEDSKCPPGTKFADFKEGGRMQDKDNYWHPYQLIPTVEGGELTISDEEGGKGGYTLNLNTIATGLKTLAEKYPQHWADFIAENDDATTGDVFLQCCLFGDAIYG